MPPKISRLICGVALLCGGGIAATLAITTSSLPGGTVGTSYSQTLAATGGSGDYTWSITSGALPAGLALSSAGLITGTPTTAGTAKFTVTVTDSDRATASQPLAITVSLPLTVTTSSLPNATVGISYSQTLTATGGSGGNTWSIPFGTLPAGLELSASGTISGTPTAAGTSSFYVTVTDNENRTATQLLGLTTTTLPPLTITTSSLPNGTVGTSYSQTLAATGGSGGYTWSIKSGALPAGLALSGPGAISGTPTAAGTANFTVTVTDSGNRTASQALGITVNYPTLTITTSSLPNGTVGTGYSQTLAATGGSGGYAWSIKSGALPAGLALSGSGAIGGTPTAAGTANFTVTVTDSGNRTASQALGITINYPTLTITTSSLPNATAGTNYSQTLAATGGSGGYTWSVSTGALPAGLTLAPGGTISGIPAAAGTASFTVQVKDSGSAVATRIFSLTVAPATLIITTASLPGAEQSVSYAQTLSATGGTGTYTWSVSSGALPAGLSMDLTGRITGTVSGTTSSFTAQVLDSSGTAAGKTFTIVVTPAPTFSSAQSTLAAGVIGGSYNVVIAVSGGQAPYTFGVISGQLPPGLALNPGSGQISGTPGQVGSFTFVLQVRDAAGGQGQGTFAIVIGNALTITSAPVLPGASLSVAYQATLAATGGQPPYTWSATAGALPAGLTFSANGQIAGTPTAAGSFQFTAAVTDARGGQASKAFTLAVAPALTISTAPQLPSAVLGVSYTGTLTASGGTPPYTWSVSAGAVPPGLTFAAGLLTGTPSSAGTYNFTAVVTDSANLTAQKAFTLVVAQGVQFTTAAQLPDANAGTPYSFTMQAAGGSPPYSWQLTAGALPGGLSLNASSGVISGTPSAAGTFNFTIQVTDSANLTASRVETLVTDLPPLPALSVAGIPATMAALQQLPVDLTVAAAFPVAVTGQLNLTFVPANGLPDDPAVQFSSGGRSVSFTLAANATHASFGSALAIQAGSVAGTIQFTVDSLTAGTAALSGPTAPVSTTQVAAGPPVISSVTVTPGTSGFSVQVVGLSTTRDLVNATVQFVPTAGNTIQTTQANISLSGAAGTWFGSSQSSAYGGQFTLTLPFSVEGGTAPLGSVSVVLTNSVGSSPASSAAY